MEKVIQSVAEKLAWNKEQIRKGTILAPLDHASYSPEKAESLKRQAQVRDTMIASANTVYENAVG